MIRPGLERISRLLKHFQRTWKAIHVAGTNGKGSTCAYLSAMLNQTHLRTGRFTSPHIIDKWDCIVVNEQPISESIFKEVEAAVQQYNSEESIDASEFELLTATAFQIFNRENVDVAIIECGMGGRLDATNVLETPLVTVITRIGLDHQAYLGDTLAEIAREKAGIMKPPSPCVIDGTNDSEPLTALQAAAGAAKVQLYLTPTHPNATTVPELDPCIEYQKLFSLLNLDPTRISAQASNIWTAFAALILALPQLGFDAGRWRDLIPAMSTASLPGRCQSISIASLTERKEPVLLDGAHNEQAFKQLASHVESALRPAAGKRVTWLLALSRGKDPSVVFAPIHEGDCLITVEFGPVDGMPWVQPVGSEGFNSLCEAASAKSYDEHIHMGKDVEGALKLASEKAAKGPLVIAGSLYLISDVLRLLRNSQG